MVTFVVPCYKLAHLLPECVESILSQTYGDFEVLIMDDCSPDNTAEVAQSFTDPRVRHIRNEPNLGHLRNYNKGIGLAKGKYVWLISADDRLRVPYVLERYVNVMEQQPEAGFACCPGFEMQDGKETRVAAYSIQAEHDRIFKGSVFLKRLFASNSVIAASGFVRKTCYDQIGAFPLDMPYAGDWFMWCVLALHYDVAYFAEPMVNYRMHDMCITGSFLDRNPSICVDDDLSVLWRLKKQIEETGQKRLAEKCSQAIGYQYAQLVAGKRYRSHMTSLTVQECDKSIDLHARSLSEAAWLRARFRASLGDLQLRHKDSAGARHSYRLALGELRWMPAVWLKLFLTQFGTAGLLLRRALFALRNALADASPRNPGHRHIGHRHIWNGKPAAAGTHETEARHYGH